MPRRGVRPRDDRQCQAQPPHGQDVPPTNHSASPSWRLPLQGGDCPWALVLSPYTFLPWLVSAKYCITPAEFLDRASIRGLALLLSQNGIREVGRPINSAPHAQPSSAGLSGPGGALYRPLGLRYRRTAGRRGQG